MIGMTSVDTTPASRHADINIFTVASGLLYEVCIVVRMNCTNGTKRFASIMILSVMRHTNSTVKFWFIVRGLQPLPLRF